MIKSPLDSLRGAFGPDGFAERLRGESGLALLEHARGMGVGSARVADAAAALAHFAERAGAEAGFETARFALPTLVHERYGDAPAFGDFLLEALSQATTAPALAGLVAYLRYLAAALAVSERG